MQLCGPTRRLKNRPNTHSIEIQSSLHIVLRDKQLRAPPSIRLIWISVSFPFNKIFHFYISPESELPYFVIWILQMRMSSWLVVQVLRKLLHTVVQAQNFHDGNDLLSSRHSRHNFWSVVSSIGDSGKRSPVMSRVSFNTDMIRCRYTKLWEQAIQKLSSQLGPHPALPNSCILAYIWRYRNISI